MKVIGLCGPSCSGKSTIANVLAKKLGANLLCLDEFYIHHSPKIYLDVEGEKIRTFERPELYDGSRLAETIKTLKDKGEVLFRAMDLKTFQDRDVLMKKKDFLIVEGFLLYTYPELNSIVDYKFFIDVPFDKILERRMMRGGRPKSDDNFAKIGFSEKELYCDPQRSLPFTILLDGDKSLDELCDEIYSVVLFENTNHDWIFLERPGYLGRKKNEVEMIWNKKYGVGNWRLAYQWGDSIISRRAAIQIYEDGYCEFFKKNSDVLQWLVSTASDVYDTAPSNVASGLNYEIQETKNNHLQDIAIRRAVRRLGKNFRGDHLIHVRWTESEGFRMNPGVVPFHMPGMIVSEEVKDHGSIGIWWHKNTIEDFYQRNKILQIRK